MASSRQKGNVRENRCARFLESSGYCVYPSRGSRGIDLFAVHSQDRSAPHLAIEVGGKGKRLRMAFAELRSAPKPAGTVCLVARWLTKPGRRPWFRWHVHEDAFYDDLVAALAVLKHL